jgi:hypothetical protein
MKWEELKVYRPLTKEELKPAYKHFTKIIADNLKAFGFFLHGRKLIRVSNDLLHIIHVDTRGNWMGINEYFKIDIAVMAVCDKSSFIRGFELTGCKRIEDISKNIRDHSRITQEYPLLADFITRRIIEYVIPYFDKYNSSGKVLDDRKSFKLADHSKRNENLILFAELLNRKNVEAGKINEKALVFYSSINSGNTQLDEYFEEMELYKRCLYSNDWTTIEQKLQTNKTEVFRKLKIKGQN